MSTDIKLIMPMAGLGTRFSDRYAMPKPLVDAGGLPLFARSVECIRVEFSQKIFLTAYQHQLTPKIKEFYPDATVPTSDLLISSPGFFRARVVVVTRGKLEAFSFFSLFSLKNWFSFIRN